MNEKDFTWLAAMLQLIGIPLRDVSSRIFQQKFLADYKETFANLKLTELAALECALEDACAAMSNVNGDFAVECLGNISELLNYTREVIKRKNEIIQAQ